MIHSRSSVAGPPLNMQKRQIWTAWHRKVRAECCARFLKTTKPGSDIANMSILGYAPEQYYTGRGPLEAMSMGIDLLPDDVAYRCNIVTVQQGIMADFSAGHISSAEGAALFAALAPHLRKVMLRPGVSYRNLLVVPHGDGAESTPPHDIVGQSIS